MFKGDVYWMVPTFVDLQGEINFGKILFRKKKIEKKLLEK